MTDPKRNPFRIAQPAVPAGSELKAVPASADDAAESVAEMIASTTVFAFIKGTRRQPMCGFSAKTVAVLEALSVPYTTFDVLADENIRSAAKAHSSWPTFPQVYVRGDLIGGNDIVSEMYASGELQKLTEGLA